jgi:hypothetical protein
MKKVFFIIFAVYLHAYYKLLLNSYTQRISTNPLQSVWDIGCGKTHVQNSDPSCILVRDTIISPPRISFKNWNGSSRGVRAYALPMLKSQQSHGFNPNILRHSGICLRVGR